MSVCESGPVVDILNELESGAGYVDASALERLSGRELWQLRREGGPVELVAMVDVELFRRSGSGMSNRLRARAYFLAEFYAWSARKPTVPAGGHPLTGEPWRRFDPVGMAIARAENIAAARVAFGHARAWSDPLERLRLAEEVARSR